MARACEALTSPGRAGTMAALCGARSVAPNSETTVRGMREPAGRDRRVVLVALRRPNDHPWAVDAAFDAVEAWLNANGRIVVHRVWQRRRAPDAATYLGRGKAEQLRALCDLWGVDELVLDGTPSASQRAKIEHLVGRPVLDRSIWARPRVLPPTAARTQGVNRTARQRRGCFTVMLAGCAGAGKSTLFAALTNGPCLAPSWPPARSARHLAVLTRRLRGAPEDRPVVVTDTPGLVRSPETGRWQVPPETADEQRHADLVLHVVDAAHPAAQRAAAEVQRILTAGEASPSRPVWSVWAQTDRLQGQAVPTDAGWIVSGRTGFGCDRLIGDLRRVARQWQNAKPGPNFRLLVEGRVL